MTDTEIRQKAASLVEEKGWLQGVLWGPKGEVCALGALLIAAEVPSLIEAPPFFEDLVANLEEEIDTGESLDVWNDKDGRTQQQVVAALRGGQS